MIVFRKMQMARSTLLLLFLLLFASTYAHAQPGDSKTSASATSQLDDLRAKGSDALFNLEYEAARQTFKEMARRFPDDPIGPHMLAWTLWLETLNQSRLRQGAIYSSQSFQANSEDKPDPRDVHESCCLSRQATHLA